MAVTKAILEKWMVAQKRHRLSDRQVQMARELGLNPRQARQDRQPQGRRSGKLRFHCLSKVSISSGSKREEPETVKPLKQIMAEMEAKKKLQKEKKKERKMQQETGADII